MTQRPCDPSASRQTRAFTLVELLIVIAIIAILAAVVFPVFSSVREKTRQATCMSNLRQIQQALKDYHRDNRSYPEYLFGPALAGRTMEQAAGDTKGLYPDYLRSLEVYHCPNSDVDTPGSTETVTVQRPEAPAGAPVERAFYRYSSYEANPAINPSTRKLDPGRFAARYSLVWTPLLDAPPGDPAQRALYDRQLRWKTVPEGTYVTVCTYHVPHGQAIVLWLDGTSKAVDVVKLDGVRNAGGTEYDMHRFGPAGPVP